MKCKDRVKWHFIIKQAKRPLCFMIVMVVVFSYTLNTFAATTVSDYIDWFTFSGFSQDVQSYPCLSTQNITIYAQQDNIDMSVVTGGFWRSVSGVYPANQSTFNSGVKYNGRTVPSKLNIDGVIYDITNCYWFITGTESAYMNLNIIVGEGQIALVDNYIVSEKPFFYTTNLKTDNATSWSFNGVPDIIYVSSKQTNGYYCSNYSGNLRYTGTNMSCYASSSNGSTGFTNFSVSSTDFSFENDNYDFNFLKTGFGIIAGSDPVPEDEDNSVLGQYYTYAQVNGNFGPSSNTSLSVHASFSMNEYMRTHPEEYKVNIDYVVIPFIVQGNHYFQCHHEYSLGSLIGYGHYQVPDGSFSDTVDFDHLIWNTEQLNLSTHILQEYRNRYPSSSDNMSNSDVFRNILNWGVTSESSGKDIDTHGGVNIGEWYINNLLSNWITEMQASCTISIVWIGGEPEFTSGEYTWQYRTGKGTEVIKNTIGNNFNPPETYDPLYPQQITDSNGNVVVNGNPINVEVYNQAKLTLEYLFHIDIDDLLTMQSSLGGAVNEVIGVISNQTNSGFWAVVHETMGYIPDEIWGWIKGAVALVVTCAVYNAFLSNKRLKS